MAETNILEKEVNPILAAPQETDEERRKHAAIARRHQEVINAATNIQQGNRMFDDYDDRRKHADFNNLKPQMQPIQTQSVEEIRKQEIQRMNDNLHPTPKKTQQEAEDWLNSYWAKQIEAERERELNRLKGERLGKSIGDFAHVLGDMIQASGGAPVAVRDIQKKYDSLSAEQQKAYDNYFARMDALRKQVEAREQAEKDAERDAKERRALAEYNAQQAAQLQQKKQIYEALQKQQDHEYKMKQIQEMNKGRNQAAHISGSYKGKQETPTQPEMYNYGNYEVNIPASEITSRYLAALNYILENDKDGKYLTLDVSNLKLENIKDLVLLYQYGKDAETIASILNGNYDDDETMPGVKQ